jgi:hypothetical protein
MLCTRRGEELQKKLCGTEGTRPTVNLEQEESILKDAFALFHGNASGVALNAMVPENQRTQPARPAGRCVCLCYWICAYATNRI